MNSASNMPRIGTKVCKKPESKSSIQFDHLLADKGNKPSTAKVSVAAVHRWGMTSFTSLRKTHLNGQKEVPAENEEQHCVKRVKVDTKNTFGTSDDPFSFESDIDSPTLKDSFSSHKGSANSRGAPYLVDVKPAAPKPNKFFKSGTPRFNVVGQRKVQRKNDFDALRLSVSANSCNRVNLNRYSPQTFPLESNAVSFQSATSDTVLLKECPVNTSTTCASTNFFTSAENQYFRSASPSTIINVNSPTNMFKENIRTAPSPESPCSPLSISAEEFLCSVRKPRANVKSSNSGHVPNVYRTPENVSCIGNIAGYNANSRNVSHPMETKDGKDLIALLKDAENSVQQGAAFINIIEDDDIKQNEADDHLSVGATIDLVSESESLSSRPDEEDITFISERQRNLIDDGVSDGTRAIFAAIDEDKHRPDDLFRAIDEDQEKRTQRDFLDDIIEANCCMQSDLIDSSDEEGHLMDAVDVNFRKRHLEAVGSQTFGRRLLDDDGDKNLRPRDLVTGESSRSRVDEKEGLRQRDIIDMIDDMEEKHLEVKSYDAKRSDFTKSCADTKTAYSEPSSCKSVGDGLEFKQCKKSYTYPLDSHQKVTDCSQQQLRRTKKIFSSSKKNKAVYNHRHWQATKDPEQQTQKEPDHVDSGRNIFDIDVDDEGSSQFPLVRRMNLVKPSKEVNDEELNPVVQDKMLVIMNVKQAYQCHESGETQEFNDDIEYLLECIQESNVIGTRCLSVLSLATKCMGPAFRIHLRAHGTMPRIFSALQDAPSDPNLSLCTATLLFVLSQDRLSMDLDGSTLSLMLQLLESDPGVNSKERELELILEDPALCAMQEKHREKVYQLCEQMQQKGHAKHLKLDNVNTGILAMETLLSLTSRKTGEWFKESIRTLHGLDHIVNTVTACVLQLIPDKQEIISNPSEAQLDKIQKIDRCLRVLENVSYMNAENKVYLVQFKDSLLVSSLLCLLKLFEDHLMANPLLETTDSSPDDAAGKSAENGTLSKTGLGACGITDANDASGKAEGSTASVKVEDPVKIEKKESAILSCFLSLLRVLLNITNDNPTGSSTVGSTEGLMENIMVCIFQLPRVVPSDKTFDVLVLSLGIMINLVEHCYANAKQIVDMYVRGSFDTDKNGIKLKSIDAFIDVLLSRLNSARQSEEQADALLSSQEERNLAAAVVQKESPDSATSQADDIEETLMKTLQKAKKHMEHSIVAAYIALLLGCIIENNKEYAAIMKDHLPDGKLDVMADVLQKFHSFVSLTNAVANTGLLSLERIIAVLQSS